MYDETEWAGAKLGFSSSHQPYIREFRSDGILLSALSLAGDVEKNTFTSHMLTNGERKNVRQCVLNFLGTGGWSDEPGEQLRLAQQLATEIECAAPAAARLLGAARNGEYDAVYLSNLPSDAIIAEPLCAALAAFLGELYNLDQQNGGKLVMQLRPNPHSVGNTNSTTGEFDWHTDDAALPRDARVKFISLFGQINPVGTLTSYACLSKAMQILDTETIRHLTIPKFMVRVPESFRVGEVWVGPMPIISANGLGQAELQYPSYATKPADLGDEAAKRALTALYQALDTHGIGVALNPGCFLAFNNLRGAHKRDRIGNQDRLVLRAYSIETYDLLYRMTGAQPPVFPTQRLVDAIIT